MGCSGCSKKSPAMQQVTPGLHGQKPSMMKTTNRIFNFGPYTGQSSVITGRVKPSLKPKKGKL